MSVGIVRVQKMTRGSVKGIEIHDRREKGLSHTNSNIDWSRSKLNYDLHSAQNRNFTKAVNERISALALKRAVRKDAVVMAQVLVTSDHDFFQKLSPEKQRKFFQDSYDFLVKRYGAENVISATVHLDEATPHMHFNFVPVTDDGRLSSKSVLTRQALIDQQTEFCEQVGRKYGLQRGQTKAERLEKGNYRKNMTMPEYKAYTAELEGVKKQVDDLSKAIEDYRQIEQKAAQSASKATEEARNMQGSMAALQAEYEAKMAFIRACDEASQISAMYPDYVELRKSLFGKETVTVPKEKWEKRHISVNEKQYFESLKNAFEKAVIKFRKSSSGEYISSLEKKVIDLERENKELITKNSVLHDKTISSGMETDKIMNRVNRVLNKLPNDIAGEFIKQWKAEERLERDVKHRGHERF